jgi:hypothetical protein
MKSPLPLALDTSACCICGRRRRCRTIIHLPWLSPTPGRGWGCVICGIPPYNAIALICDACANEQLQGRCQEKMIDRIRWVVAGDQSLERLAIGDLVKLPAKDHDPEKHRLFKLWQG